MTFDAASLARLLKDNFVSVSIDADMATLTTWRVGGKASLLCEPADEEQLISVLAAIRERSVPWIVIGAGSNLLVADTGFTGVVITLGAGFRKIEFEGRRCLCGAAVTLAKLINEACSRSLGDLTYLTGIPGTLGGALAGNAGARGQDISKYLRNVRIVDEAGAVIKSRNELTFGYRQSPLMGIGVITAAEFFLDPVEIDILEKNRERFKEERSQQPQGTGLAGCVFKNPGPDIAAGYLIDSAGLKETRIGGAYVSPEHANFIINDGTASAADIIDLIKLIKRRVLEISGFELEPEIVMIGDDT